MPLEKERLFHALKNSLIFGELPTSLLAELTDIMPVSAIAGGEALYRQGDDSDSLALIISGRFIVQQQREDGSTVRLGEIGSGRCVGELGLILEQTRAADVMAVRDSTVASLSREDFEQRLAAHPVVFNRAITRRVSEYSASNTARAPSLGATNYAVVPLAAHMNISEFSTALHKALSKHSSAYYFSAQDGEAFHSEEGASISSSHHFNDLEQQHQYLLLEATFAPTAWSHLAIRQADHIILVADPEANPLQLNVADDILQALHKVDAKISLVVLHPEQAKTAHVDSQWHQAFSLQRIYPVRLARSAEIERFARFLTGHAVGLVLGGGGARGMAHVGVMAALEEAGIPVDMVCGNSMGALIGAQYANGVSPNALISSTRRFIQGGERPTLPFFSLLAGKRIKKGLRRLFGKVQVEALWRPFFAVSCNLSRASVHVHDSGRLWQAVLASNSPAGILPPVILDGEFFVDAALLDNVPVAAMRDQIGFGTLIAVDVDVRDELTVDPSIKKLSPWRAMRQYFLRSKKERLPNIMDLLNRSGHLGGLARREASIALADHYLQPPVSQFGLMAYGKSEAIAEAGYVYTKQHIAAIKQSLQ
jgi:NTE family protein/lysophospholipid hydrolase